MTWRLLQFFDLTKTHKNFLDWGLKMWCHLKLTLVKNFEMVKTKDILNLHFICSITENGSDEWKRWHKMAKVDPENDNMWTDIDPNWSW